MTNAAIEEKAKSKHQMVRRGVKAFCTCGAWECRTNEVVEADIAKTLRREHSHHVRDQIEDEQVQN